MFKAADKISEFKFKQEEGLNPYIGFMSFQHFQGDPIYSDCIVKPENHFCETEHYECYPIPEYVEEKGCKNGYVMWPVRTAVSGKQMTPCGATEIMEIIGKEESLKRIETGLAMLEKALNA